MKPEPATPLSPLVWTIVAGLLAVTLLLAAKGWIEDGAGIFLSMAESGMAWCF